MLAHPLTNEGAGDNVNRKITFFRVSIFALGYGIMHGCRIGFKLVI
jgi:hypothetical protein